MHSSGKVATAGVDFPKLELQLLLIVSSEDALNCSLPSVLGGGDVVLAAVKHLAGEWSADQVVVDVVWWCCFLIVVDSGGVVVVSGSVVPSYN